MKSTITLATTLILFSSVLGSVTTFAADGDSTTTTGKIVFKAGGTDPDGNGQVEPPIHPDIPGEIITPGEVPGGNTGEGGPFSLDFAPNLDFDINNIDTKDATYFAKLQVADNSSGETIEVPNFAQITDKRGTGAGWNLSVTQKGQLKTGTGKILTGAEISFANPVIMSSIADENQNPKITYTGVALNGPEEVSVPLMSAGVDKGMGQYQIKFGTEIELDKEDLGNAEESVMLKVPGSTVKYADTYTTNLVWILADSPENKEV